MNDGDSEDDSLEEDWSDDDDDLDEEEAAQCPECGGPVQIITDKCPRCGYWLSEGDRRAMWSGMERPVWLRVVAWVVLLAFLASLLVAGFAIF